MWHKSKTPLLQYARRHYEAFSDVGAASREVARAKAVTKAMKTTYKTVNLRFGSDARMAIVRGVQRLAETVMVTLGPGVRSQPIVECRAGMWL
jgi:hypothetical protein